MAVAALPAMMSIGSAIIGGIGAKAGAEATADAKYRAAQVARARAEQTDLASRQELERTLSNIVAVRAASGGDIMSPTTSAVMARQQEIGDRNRIARVSSENIRANQLEQEGAMSAKAGQFGLAGGILKAIPGFGSLFGSIDFGGGGSSSGYSLGGALG